MYKRNSKKVVFGILGSLWLMLASAGAMSAESSVQMLASVEQETKQPFNYTQLKTSDLFYLDSLVSKSPGLARAILIVANRCDVTPTVNAMRFIGADSQSIIDAHDGGKWRSTFNVSSEDCSHLRKINAHISQAGSLGELAWRVYDNPSAENREAYAQAIQHTFDTAQSMANAITR